MTELTDEMRRAVMVELCETDGHVINSANAVQFEDDPDDIMRRRAVVKGPDGKSAHLVCGRCGKVWLIIEAPGEDYADAVGKLEEATKRGKIKDHIGIPSKS